MIDFSFRFSGVLQRWKLVLREVQKNPQHKTSPWRVYIDDQIARGTIAFQDLSIMPKVYAESRETPPADVVRYWRDMEKRLTRLLELPIPHVEHSISLWELAEAVRDDHGLDDHMEDQQGG